MSTQLTAQALPGVAGVLLTLVDAPDDAVILRTDSNGTRPVRLLPDQAPISGSLTVRDYEAALTGPVTYQVDGTRTNLVPNPSGEVNTSNWGIGGGRLTGSVVADATAPSGAKVLRFTANQAVSSSAGYVLSTTGTQLPGQRLAFAASVRSSIAVNYLARIRYADAAGAALLDTSGPTTALTVGAWTRLTVSAPPAPAGTTQGSVFIIAVASMASGDYFDVDAAIAEKHATATGPYIDTTAPQLVTATTALDLQLAVYSTARLPARRTDAGTVTGWAEGNPSSALVHVVPGRPDPIVRGGVQRLRTGTATLRFPSYAEASAAKAISDGEVVMLRVPGAANTGMDWYARIERPDLSPAEVDGTAAPDWELTLPFVEVAPPEAPLSGAADWTLADVPTTAPTIRDLALTFATIRALAVGP